jgi:bacterioferritin
MQATAQIIAQLNRLLFNELTAINQYFLHARMLDHWGYRALGEQVYRESLGEMRHADALIQRTLFLDGLPNLQDLGKLRIGENVHEIIESDLALETLARNDTSSAIAFFEQEHDFVSRDIATKILIDSEAHIDYLEQQRDLFRALGEANYLQSAAGSLKSAD